MPTRGTTRTYGITAQSQRFQSTCPRGARHAADAYALYAEISIHVPTRGTTRGDLPEDHFNVFQVRSENMFANKKELQQFNKSPYVIHYGDRYFKPWFKLPLIPYWCVWRRFKRLSEWSDFKLREPERLMYTIAKIFYTKLKFKWYKLTCNLR